jgi:hypothetical protein
MFNQLSRSKIDIGAAEHLVIAVVRNEMLRLPYWLSFYRGIGFDRFMVIDNGSDDGTTEYLQGQADVHLFYTSESYRESGFGMVWVNRLLDTYCSNHWILVADADELLVWPGSEQDQIRQLTARLDAANAAAMVALLLDMYSDRPFGTVGYTPGAPFLIRCPFFDGQGYSVVPAQLFPYRQIYGGVRARVSKTLSAGSFHPPTISKVPLVRWRTGQAFALSTHGLAQPIALAPLRGALLHFKMFDDLPEKCRMETTRGEHFAGGREYRILGECIDRAPTRNFYDPRISVRYAGTDQLVALNLLSTDRAFE